MRPLLALLVACQGPTSDGGDRLELVAMTFNTGTTEAKGDEGPDDGYGPAEALVSDTWYGDGLAWLPVVDQTRAFLQEQRPDVIGFQEIFWPGDCASIPIEDRAGWFCEGWTAGDPTVAEFILGPDYQVACHDGKPDKCLAVRTDFATIRGCEGAFCLDGLDGAEIEGCGNGSRVGRAVLDLAEGGELTVVNVHGSSGFTPEDRDCRTLQFELVFDEMDGDPAANGARNLVFGDFNTDPGRAADADPSAAYLAELRDRGWTFLTEVGPEAEPTYAGVFNIDHVLSDTFVGDCEVPSAVTEVAYFDHLPIRCAVEARKVR